MLQPSLCPSGLRGCLRLQSDRGAPAHGEHLDACVLGRFSCAVILGCVWIAARCRKTWRPCWPCKGPISCLSTIRRTKQGLRRTCHCGRSPTTRAFCNESPGHLSSISGRVQSLSAGAPAETPPGDPSVDKWIKMLKRWDHYLPSEKLRLRVFKGVPPQVREQVWLRLLKVNQVKARNAGKYQEMKEAALVSSWDIMQINLDVNRTFRSHTMFWDHYGVGQRALFHVLAAYSVYDTEVGYCQGMSKIAAILLTFLPEEDAFWALAQLMTIDRHAMHGFFIPGFQKLLRFQAHLERVLERAVPDLKKHMDEEQMSTGIYTPKWFPQCFLSRTPFSLTLKLWDVYTGWGAGAHGHGLHHPQGAQE
ncbi:USP6 N-terminal-like protein isoform 2-T5 [Lycaon pictus]